MTATLPDAPPVSPLPAPEGPRWRPLRAGLQNVWQYDHATRFVFHRGRLLLRGRNGAGKTKVIEVLLPFLLEGRLSPARLDPFGTRSRKMHYNLLHAGNADARSAIGYVWLEFGRRDADGRERYVTIGAGLKARRSSDAVESWFFVVEDDRVDVDLNLLHDDHRPRTRSSLAEVLGDRGRVLDTARDYRAAVNRALYGVESDQYEALVEALLRLRQPHLSERLDPDEVGAVLADSLPPLDADKVHEVAEGFERLESHRRDLDDRRRTLGAVEQFLDDYRSYAATVAAVRARELTRADSAVRAAAEREAAAQGASEEAVATAAALETEITTAGQQLDATRTRIRTLETSDEYRAVQQLEEAERASRRDADLVAAAERRHGTASAAAAQTRRQAKEARDDVEQRARGADEVGRTAAVAAAAAELRGEHAAIVEQVPHDDGTTSAAAGLARVVHDQRRAALAAVEQKVAAVSQARQGERLAQQRLDDLDAEAHDHAERLHVAEDAQRAAVAAHDGEVALWADRCAVLQLHEDALATILERDPLERRAPVAKVAHPVRRRLDADVAESETAARQLAAQIAEVQQDHDRLAAATHQPPPAPGWRRAHRDALPGAPLYLLAEFTTALGAAAQANVEAALHAAGLLDAWVTPEGGLLDPDTLDVVLMPPGGGAAGGADSLRPGGGASSRTLADVAHPTPHGDVPAEVIGRVLGSVGLLDGLDAGAATPPGRAHWVSTNGQFRLGPLYGTARSDTVAYLGETARRRAREQRLAELVAALDRLAARERDARGKLEAAREQRQAVDDELDRFPAADAVLAARATVRAAAEQLEQARARLVVATAARDQARGALQEAEAARDASAAEHGLVPYVDRLSELAVATAAWREATRDWLHAVDRLLDGRARAADLERGATDAQGRTEQAAAELAAAQRQHAATSEQVTTLRDAVGATRDDLLATLAGARADEETLGRQLIERQAAQVAAAEAVGAARAERNAAGAAHGAARDHRTTAADGFRVLGKVGVLQQLPGDPPPGDPADWSLTAALEQARQVGKLGPRVPDDAEAVDAMLSQARNRLARRQQELLRELVAGIRLFPADHRGVIVYEAQHQGRTYRLDALVTELGEDVAERDARLHDDEQELLESFLAGELHEHLRARIRDATDLVGAMNDQLARCRTAAAQQLRLRWRVAEHAPPATEQAVELLLRGSGLLTDDQRDQLRTYLHERLRQAREGEAVTSLFERIAAAFDYRRWHAFTIEYRAAGAASWRRLTRQAHGTGSGGEKAVMLHLPLFAAMAAHYHGRPSAPRLIVLDEVFAGIDRGTRGQLMGLLVELDLDVVLTSHEEWGFYRELDGLSTYHLIRDPEVPGVLAEWFVWDGADRWEMT